MEIDEGQLSRFLVHFDGPCSVCIACNRMFGSEKSPRFTDDRLLPLIETAVRRGLVGFVGEPDMTDEDRSEYCATQSSRTLILVLSNAGREHLGLPVELPKPAAAPTKKNRQESSRNLLDLFGDE